MFRNIALFISLIILSVSLINCSGSSQPTPTQQTDRQEIISKIQSGDIVLMGQAAFKVYENAGKTLLTRTHPANSTYGIADHMLQKHQESGTLTILHFKSDEWCDYVKNHNF